MKTTIKPELRCTGKSIDIAQSAFGSDLTLLHIDSHHPLDTGLGVHIRTAELVAAATPPVELPDVVERDGKLWIDGKWICRIDTDVTPERWENHAEEYERLALNRRAIAAHLRTKEAAAKDAEAEAAKQAAYDLRHDELGLEALALRNDAYKASYGTWEDTNKGTGSTDHAVQLYRARAQAARDAKATAEAELAKLRDEVAKEIQTGGSEYRYVHLNAWTKRAVDLIIDARKAGK